MVTSYFFGDPIDGHQWACPIGAMVVSCLTDEPCKGNRHVHDLGSSLAIDHAHHRGKPGGGGEVRGL